MNQVLDSWWDHPFPITYRRINGYWTSLKSTMVRSQPVVEKDDNSVRKCLLRIKWLFHTDSQFQVFFRIDRHSWPQPFSRLIVIASPSVGGRQSPQQLVFFPFGQFARRFGKCDRFGTINNFFVARSGIHPGFAAIGIRIIRSQTNRFVKILQSIFIIAQFPVNDPPVIEKSNVVWVDD